MGCHGSKSPKAYDAAQMPGTVMDKRRQHLSVSHVEDSIDDVSAQPTINSDLSILLAQWELEHGLGSPRSIVGSQPDDEMTSFAVKASGTLAGDDLAATRYGIGITCRKGLKPESVNQDAWLMMEFNEFSAYAVFDGHGKRGHDVSNFVKELMPRLILSDARCKTQEWEMLLKDAFFKAQAAIKAANKNKELAADMSGTTCTVVIHCHIRRQLIVAHVADSRAVLGTKTGDECRAYALTRDHKPDLADEKARIEEAGGRVVHDGYANYRVMAGNASFPGLNMSRCLGDLVAHGHCGITCEPEISVVDIDASIGHLLLVCSDGVWNFWESHKVVQTAHKLGAFTPAQTQDAADAVAKKAWDRWIKEEEGTVVDDITVIMVRLGGKINEASADGTPAVAKTASAASPVLLGNKASLQPKEESFSV